MIILFKISCRAVANLPGRTFKQTATYLTRCQSNSIASFPCLQLFYAVILNLRRSVSYVVSYSWMFVCSITRYSRGCVGKVSDACFQYLLGQITRSYRETRQSDSALEKYNAKRGYAVV